MSEAKHSNMQEIKLSELLSTKEIKEVERLINSTPVDEITKKLKDYLNEEDRKARLLKKGVLGDYLAYYLYAKIKKLI